MRYLKLLALIISCFICGFCVAEIYNFICFASTGQGGGSVEFFVIFILYSAFSFVVYFIVYCNGKDR